MFEQDLRTLSHVDRWGTVRRVTRQNVAEHSYFVAVYAAQIADRILWSGNRADLLMWALAHDTPECFSGDIQGPTKRAVVDPERMRSFEKAEMERRFPESFMTDYVCSDTAFDDDVRLIVKCADIADEAAYLAMEMSLGNVSVEDVLRENVIPRLRAAWLALPMEAEVGPDLEEIWQTEVLPTFSDMSVSNTRHMVQRV